MTDTPPPVRTGTAARIDDAPAVRQAKPRRCLLCSVQFDSEWAGDRVCHRCRRSSTWRQGIPKLQGSR